ncbi:flavodoxin reductase family protein [Mycolicibacterium canariasense]|uniref:nitric oxide dioxygenase n=1 Tax=Mycolicibacterium canariasense TaxID=228230 RepID=A0A100WI65_MYCCR|nr:MOSC domain-containing protein [Mycolicibacterium canariasense]MCV7211718.1 MOSC domain-containing protein [Mycolicibacterium canariasense]ORV08249.1 sulfurase [Mycolicibacterium canariasense]GAS98243.1 flavodoxin reductase family protein [Mycolicibacterium canariasense]
MATLVSVNVGMPKDVPWKGRTVHTGAWKAPVTGPRMLRRLNIDGDGQGDTAGHGGENRAVLVYQVASYQHWAREFGRDDLVPGVLGENLTVDGLPDDEVCIGDRYRIGDAVVEVTQPRVTCYRAGLRIGEPRMAALLVAHRRTGFYCRVLTEGEIEAGQDIVKIDDGPERVTVAEMDALLYLPGHSRDDLERGLRIPALSPGWRQSLQSLLDQAAGTTEALGNSGLTGVTVPPPAWPGFRPMRVAATHVESQHVRSLLLANADGTPSPEWIAGQSITLRLPAGPNRMPLVRNYSLSNAPGTSGYRITVKQEPVGTVSTYIHEHLDVGDVVDVAAPRGSFCVTAGTEPILLVSAGVGVTPVLSMLHHLQATQPTRPVWWLHGARNGDEHPFAAETRALLGALPNGRARVFYSRPSATDRIGVDYDQQGHLDAEAVATLSLPRDGSAYLCGPASFMDQLGAALKSYGLDAANIHAETFGARSAITPGIAGEGESGPPHLPDGPAGPGPTIAFARSALSAPWGAAYGSILEFAEACGVPTRWSCRTGVCHTCETGLLAGRVSYDLDPLDPPAPGNVLLCIAKPAEPIVLDL